MRSKTDALTLARILKADAVVIGSVTDYSPYYPQRIGLQVDWYSPEMWPSEFEVLQAARPAESLRPGLAANLDVAPGALQIRAQSADETPGPGEAQGVQPAGGEPVVMAGPECLPPFAAMPDPRGPAAASAAAIAVPGGQFDPTEPIMSYTRLFDAADSDVVNKLRDYLELRGDRRSGGWEAHLHRSEDFIRFASHLMIVEMLALHGGATKSQIVFKWRKYR
jgi:hypothetical protein